MPGLFHFLDFMDQMHLLDHILYIIYYILVLGGGCLRSTTDCIDVHGDEKIRSKTIIRPRSDHSILYIVHGKPEDDFRKT